MTTFYNRFGTNDERCGWQDNRNISRKGCVLLSQLLDETIGGWTTMFFLILMIALGFRIALGFHPYSGTTFLSIPFTSSPLLSLALVFVSSSSSSFLRISKGWANHQCLETLRHNDIGWKSLSTSHCGIGIETQPKTICSTGDWITLLLQPTSVGFVGKCTSVHLIHLIHLTSPHCFSFLLSSAEVAYPQSMILGSSRGHESKENKYFMRLTVVFSDIIFFLPSALLFVFTYYKSEPKIIKVSPRTHTQTLSVLTYSHSHLHTFLYSSRSH
jgi:hypothetical protein